MAKGYRPDRIGEEIRKIISDLLLHGLKDPRLNSLISITAVDVTSDYSYATVYFTVLGANAGNRGYVRGVRTPHRRDHRHTRVSQRRRGTTAVDPRARHRR